MGVAELEFLRTNLFAHGRAADTPFALVGKRLAAGTTCRYRHAGRSARASAHPRCTLARTADSRRGWQRWPRTCTGSVPRRCMLVPPTMARNAAWTALPENGRRNLDRGRQKHRFTAIQCRCSAARQFNDMRNRRQFGNKGIQFPIPYRRTGSCAWLRSRRTAAHAGGDARRRRRAAPCPARNRP